MFQALLFIFAALCFGYAGYFAGRGVVPVSKTREIRGPWVSAIAITMVAVGVALDAAGLFADLVLWYLTS